MFWILIRSASFSWRNKKNICLDAQLVESYGNVLAVISPTTLHGYKNEVFLITVESVGKARFEL